MAWPIHEKIQRLLKERKKRKKDLASHLNIAPQTMTDICKGRSAVTLQHLRGIMSFFGLRADYWMDDSREEPNESDRLPTATPPPGAAEMEAATESEGRPVHIIPLDRQEQPVRSTSGRTDDSTAEEGKQGQQGETSG